jgi:hypothetical protein
MAPRSARAWSNPAMSSGVDWSPMPPMGCTTAFGLPMCSRMRSMFAAVYRYALRQSPPRSVQYAIGCHTS